MSTNIDYAHYIAIVPIVTNDNKMTNKISVHATITKRSCFYNKRDWEQYNKHVAAVAFISSI